MRIELCGPIGAGKTTLANLLVNRGYSLVVDNFNINPFWEAFYLNQGKYIFETEITFLLQHYHDLKKFDKKNTNFVCDFSFVQDLGYAKIGLLGNKLKLFESVYKEILREFGLPELIIFLKCDIDILLERIKKRGRKEELLIQKRFLNNLNKMVSHEVKLLMRKVKVLKINSGEKDYLNNEIVQKQILEKIDLLLEK